jgi:hypothetical protein
MDNTDTVGEVTAKLLETVVKLEEFNKEDVNQPKSKVLRLFFLKYKCIICISVVITILMNTGTQLLTKYMSDDDIRNILLNITNQLTNETKNTM